jgi:hypothetical protein
MIFFCILTMHNNYVVLSVLLTNLLTNLR